MTISRPNLVRAYVKVLMPVILALVCIVAGEAIIGGMNDQAVVARSNTFHGGTLTETTTLPASGSPYIISEHIIVPAGVTLTIEPSVTLQFYADRSIQVKGGRLLADGTITQLILFTHYGDGYWGGILLENTQENNCITHAVIEYTREAVHNPRTHGVSAYGSQVTIADSVIRNTRASVAVQTYPWKGDYPTLYLLRNQIYNIEGDAVHPSEGYALIEGNHIHNIRHGIYPLEGIELSNMAIPSIVRNNHIHDISDDCIDLNHSSAIIADNEVHHCGDKGVSIGHPSSTTLVNNLIHTCFGKDTDQYSGTGIAIKDGAVSRIVNNTVSDCRHGIFLYEGHAGEGGGVATVLNTILWGNRSGLDWDALSTINVTYSDIEMDEGVWPGVGNINADPLFRAPPNGDYRLQEGSPCVDTGTEIGAPDEDIRGVCRPYGNGHDMGAHELEDKFHGGTLTENTTLLPDCSSYVITDDIIIPAGITLTIKPSVTLKFYASRSLLVEGKLAAVGTASQPIVFTHDSTAPWGPILFQNSTSDNRIAYATIEYVGRKAGIAAYSSTLRVEHSMIRHLNGTALLLENSQVQVLDNVIHDVLSDGVRIAGGNGIVHGNHIYDVYGGAVSSTTVPFYSLTPGTGIELTGTVGTASIQNNNVHHVAASCVEVRRSAVTIERNELHHCGNNGLSVIHPHSTTLANNLIYACQGDPADPHSGIGIAIKDGAVSHITNNTVADNKYGIYLYEEHAGQGGGAATVVNSIVWGNEVDLELDAHSAITISYSDIYSRTGTGTAIWPGEGNINADPLFRAPQNGNYRLLEESPCVDTGTSAGAPDEDIRGVRRPHGDGYDRGAHEFFEFFSCYLPLTLRTP